MHHELSKAEKKNLRIAIDKGLDAEFREGMEKFESIIRAWRQGKFTDNKEAYHKLFKAVDEKDNEIIRRYDGLSGSQYLMVVVGIYKDGYINDQDIDGLSEKTKAIINFLLED